MTSNLKTKIYDDNLGQYGRKSNNFHQIKAMSQGNCLHFFQGVFGFYVLNYTAVTYGDQSYPRWAELMGLAISFSSMMWVPIYAVYYLLSQPGTIMEVNQHYRIHKMCLFVSNCVAYSVLIGDGLFWDRLFTKHCCCMHSQNTKLA